MVCFASWQAHAANDICPSREISGAHLETCVLDPLTVQKYVDPLPILRRLDARTGGKFDIELQQVEQNLLGPGFPDTTVWGVWRK
ncbi:MAG: hypothetical protein ACE5GN_06045 [Waddliaceae bacterium]